MKLMSWSGRRDNDLPTTNRLPRELEEFRRREEEEEENLKEATSTNITLGRVPLKE